MDKKSPLVSIIIPNYNHEIFLLQRLESVFNQTIQDFEVILLDDCSTDNSLEILKKYSNHPKVSHCVCNEFNSGNTFVQWNKGIALAKGEYIWIAESDDFCELNFLEQVIKPLLEDSEVVLSYCQSNRVDENGLVTGTWKSFTDNFNDDIFNNDFVKDGNLFLEKYLVYKNVIPNASAVLIRKEIFQSLAVTNIEDELRYCGDWLLYFKIVSNKKVAFVSKILNDFRCHSQSVIAKASSIENRITIINIDFLMRSKMVLFLNKYKIGNKALILQNNKRIINELKYEKSFLHIRNYEKLKGIILLLSIFSFFVKKYQFTKNINLRLKWIFS